MSNFGKKLSSDEELSPEKAANEKILSERHAPAGLNFSTKEESLPNPRKSGREVILPGTNNSFVILGRDRVGEFEGKGFEPHPRCGHVDIVAGLASASKLSIKDNEDYPPNVFTDASRLYISQRSNVDTYFGLAKGSVKVRVDNKSCAVLKSDHTRIIGREHVKIVAGKAK